MKTTIRNGKGKFVPVTFAVALLLSPRSDARTAPESTGSTTPAIVAAHVLSVQVSGNGAGSVTSDPSGIDCDARCSASFAADAIGMKVTLTAAANGGDSVFAGWTGACSGTAPTCTVAMDAAKSVEATFAALGADVQAISAGSEHTCALTSAGAVWCWGNNANGQLGDGTTMGRLTPVAVSGLSSGVQMISAGVYHTCAVTSAGAARCWGFNDSGQLGDGSATTRLTPVTVSGLSGGVQAIGAGYRHTCAVTSTGAAWCWGWNILGQLGDDTTEDRRTPVAVSGLSGGVQAIGAGNWHTCALISAGAVQCWGANVTGQLGDGTTTNRSTPVPVSGLPGGVHAISARGGNHTCVLTSVGAAWCWGENHQGQLGDGTTTSRLTPVPVLGLSSGVQAISPDEFHTCAVTSIGAVWCWGANFNGQLGDGTAMNRSMPVSVLGLSGGLQAVSAGGTHTCALTGAGAMWCWGWNYHGQLGDGTTTDQLTPVLAQPIPSIDVIFRNGFE